MILSDRAIRNAIENGAVTIDPYLPSSVQPSSYDLRLGPILLLDTPDGDREIDLQRDGPVYLYQHQFALACTLEIVGIPSDLTAQLAGKSTVARLGLQVESAGHLDPGYRGRPTLEMYQTKKRPIRLHHGMLICQVRFFMMTSAAEHPYGSPELGSHYQGDMVPTPARFSTPVPATADGEGRP